MTPTCPTYYQHADPNRERIRQAVLSDIRRAHRRARMLRNGWKCGFKRPLGVSAPLRESKSP